MRGIFGRVEVPARVRVRACFCHTRLVRTVGFHRWPLGCDVARATTCVNEKRHDRWTPRRPSIVPSTYRPQKQLDTESSSPMRSNILPAKAACSIPPRQAIAQWPLCPVEHLSQPQPFKNSHLIVVCTSFDPFGVSFSISLRACGADRRAPWT